MRQILQKPDHEPAPSVDVIEISNCKNIVQMMRIFGMLENDLKLGAKQKPERKYFDEEKKRNGMTICLKFKMKSIKPKMPAPSKVIKHQSQFKHGNIWILIFDLF